MDEEAFNMSIRKFLKRVGVTSQREIEAEVREKLAAGELQGDEELEVEARVTVGGVAEETVVKGTIRLA